MCGFIRDEYGAQNQEIAIRCCSYVVLSSSLLKRTAQAPEEEEGSDRGNVLMVCAYESY
jgi:hypothetical protein